MRGSRVPSIAPGTFFVAQSWADCITNVAGFNLRQAQPVSGDIETARLPKFARSSEAASRGGLRAADDLSKIESGREKSRLVAALSLLSPVICVVSLRPLRPQLFDELRAQARDAAAIGTVSPTSSTGTTLTSFQ